MIRRCDLVAVLICIFYYCNAHLIIFTCNLRTISIKLLLLLLLLLLLHSRRSCYFIIFKSFFNENWCGIREI